MLGVRAPNLSSASVFALVIICLSLCPLSKGAADQYFNKNCTKLDDCKAYPGSQCLATAVANVNKCGCKTDAGYVQTGNICKIDVDLGDKCDKTYAFCKKTHSVCKHAADLSGTYRCKCDHDYIEVKENGTNLCAKELTKQNNANCTTCIDNQGKCYELPNKVLKCRCPVSREGDACEKLLVTVTCKNFLLDICYELHQGMNSSTAHVYTHGHGNVAPCRARRVTNSSSNSNFCPFETGKDKLRLTLNLNDLKTCGVSRLPYNKDYFRYETLIDAAKSDHDPNPKVFKTYCEYKRTGTHRVDSLVEVVNGNNQGKSHEPVVKFSVYDFLGRELKSEDPVRKGDLIRLNIQVLKDGVYTGVHVQRCVASNKPSLPNKYAMVVLLYEDGCVVDGQKYIPKNARWQDVMGRLENKQSGLFPAFKLLQGDSLYVICRLGFCMGNNTAACQAKTCTGGPPGQPAVGGNNTSPSAPSGNSTGNGQGGNGNNPNKTPAAPAPSSNSSAPSSNSTGSSRKKRAVGLPVPLSQAQTGQVSIKLNPLDPEEIPSRPSSGVAAKLGMSNAAFIAFLAGVVIMILILMAISTVLLIRLRKQGPEDDKVTMADRPQRFALPRNNHLRL